MTFPAAFAVSSAGILLALVLLSSVTMGKPLGFLLDRHGRYSLTRTQISGWTILLLGAFIAVFIVTGSADPVVPSEVWALLGISTGSSVGEAVIVRNKEQKTPSEEAITKAESTERSGLLHTGKRPLWADLFLGDEVGNFRTVDLTKVQMAFFTLAIGVAYTGALLATDWTGVTPPEFPPLSEGMIAMLGFSHAGYLGVSATPSTPESAGTTSAS